MNSSSADVHHVKSILAPPQRRLPALLDMSAAGAGVKMNSPMGTWAEGRSFTGKPLSNGTEGRVAVMFNLTLQSVSQVCGIRVRALGRMGDCSSSVLQDPPMMAEKHIGSLICIQSHKTEYSLPAI
jgi:hypothetical protein